MSIILGIDPGSRITGYGIIKHQQNQLHYLASGCIRLPANNLGDKLQTIFDGISQLMHEFNPDQVAVEAVFMHHNVQAALKLGQARGVAIVAAAKHTVILAEYSARQIKQAVVGYGAASKQQVQHMICQLLKLNATPQADAADALAVAICHIHMGQGIMGLTKMRGGRRK